MFIYTVQPIQLVTNFPQIFHRIVFHSNSNEKLQRGKFWHRAELGVDRLFIANAYNFHPKRKGERNLLGNMAVVVVAMLRSVFAGVVNQRPATLRRYCFNGLYRT